MQSTFQKKTRKFAFGLTVALALVVAGRFAAHVHLLGSEEHIFAKKWLANNETVKSFFGLSPSISLSASGFNFGFAGDTKFKEMTFNIEGLGKKGASKISVYKTTAESEMKIGSATLRIGNHEHSLSAKTK